MLGMNLWLRRTLYMKHFWECDWFVKCYFCLFLAVFCCCAEILACCWFCCFPGKLLSSGQSRTQSVKTLGGARISCSALSNRLLPELAEHVLLTLQQRGGRPLPVLSPGDVLLCGGGKTPLCWACLLHSNPNTGVTALHHFVSELRGETGGGVMNCSLCCLLFCPSFAC